MVENTQSSGKVIKRVFHTRTEFRIYPNGEVYPETTRSWFEDRIYMVKKKKKKKITTDYKKSKEVSEL